MSTDTRLEELGVSGLGEVDEPAFSGLAERHRRELHVHCYRMLGSFQDAEDTVQETFLRAWRRRETFEGRSTFRAWLYRIATNACLDLLAKRRPDPATGGGTFVVVGGQVPMSGQIALTYDDTTKSCQASGWILHG